MASPTPAQAAPNDARSAAPNEGGEGLLGVRVVIRTPTVESFIQKYSRFVKDDRIFIFTKSSQPPGTRLRFTLELVDGKALVSGEGTVTRVRPDTGDRTRPPGMELRFQPTDDASKKIIDLMLAERDRHAPSSAPPPRATLPPLPATGAHPAYVDSEPQTVPEHPAGAPVQPQKASPSGPSPLLSRPIAGQPTNLPRRPGGAKTMVGIGTPAGGNAAVAAATPAPAAPAPSAPRIVASVEPPAASPDPRTLALARTVSIDAPPPVTPIVATESAQTLVRDPAPSPAVAGSLFAQSEVTTVPAEAVSAPVAVAGEGSSDPAASPGSPESTPEGNDDLLHSFPGLEQPAGFAEGWRPTGNGAGLVPANPFSEVSDNAIEYFVEWSLERSTASDREDQGTSFGAVQMRAPFAADLADATTPPPARNRGVAIGLAIGLGIGVVIGGATMALIKRRPVVVTAAPAPAPSPSAAPAPSPSAAPAPSPSAAPRKGELTLTVTSRPSGADVKVDGAERGKTPVDVPVGKGPHEVVLTLDRYADYVATATAPGAIDAQLHRPKATLMVSSSPPGASVTVNGTRHGKTPLTLTVQAFEGYNVVVGSGARAWKKRVYVKAPSTSVDAVLTAVPRPRTPAPRPGDTPGVRGIGIQ